MSVLRAGFVLIMSSGMICSGEGWAASQNLEVFLNTQLERPESEIQFFRTALRITRRVSRDLLDESFDWEPYQHRLDGMIRDLGIELEHKAEPEARLAVINQYLFETSGFGPDLEDPSGLRLENLMMTSVLDRKKGACLTLSITYLSLADALGLPIQGIAAPSHFFMRYGDGQGTWYIETLEKGRLYNDLGPFKEKYYIRDDEPFYLHGLNKKKTLGVYLTSLAAVYLRQEKPEGAAVILEKVLTINPDDVEVLTNLGSAYRILGRTEDAIRTWKDATRLNAYDDKAHYNLALILYQSGRIDEAIHHYDQSLLLGHDVNWKLLRALEPHRKDSYTKPKASHAEETLQKKKTIQKKIF